MTYFCIIKNNKSMKQIVSSISDVITNSSTEVFLVKNDEALNEFVKTLKYITPWTTFNTEEDIKEHCREIYDKCCLMGKS